MASPSASILASTAAICLFLSPSSVKRALALLSSSPCSSSRSIAPADRGASTPSSPPISSFWALSRSALAPRLARSSAFPFSLESRSPSRLSHCLRDAAYFLPRSRWASQASSDAVNRVAEPNAHR